MGSKGSPNMGKLGVYRTGVLPARIDNGNIEIWKEPEHISNSEPLSFKRRWVVAQWEKYGAVAMSIKMFRLPSKYSTKTWLEMNGRSALSPTRCGPQRASIIPTS